jgi:hypothetical protein
VQLTASQHWGVGVAGVRALDDEGVRAEVSRSMADWASRASVIIASHADGSLLDTQIVDFLRWRSTTSS